MDKKHKISLNLNAKLRYTFLSTEIDFFGRLGRCSKLQYVRFGGKGGGEEHDEFEKHYFLSFWK